MLKSTFASTFSAFTCFALMVIIYIDN